eukprot:365289-Chlamydomonas_euryale.AAC.28
MPASNSSRLNVMPVQVAITLGHPPAGATLSLTSPGPLECGVRRAPATQGLLRHRQVMLPHCPPIQLAFCSGSCVKGDVELPQAAQDLLC